MPEDLAPASQIRDTLLIQTPGWLFSLAIHGAILLSCGVFISSTPGRASRGAPGLAFEADWIGLPGGDSAAEYPEDSSFGQRDVEPLPTARFEAPAPSQPSEPEPSEIEKRHVPAKREAVSAASPAPTSVEPIPQPPEGRPNAGHPGRRGRPGDDGSGIGGAGGGGDEGGTQFFGIRSRGTHVAYVIDCSGSMLNNGAMRAAKAELIASLDELRPPARFHILFYNQTVREMPLGLKPEANAAPRNRNLDPASAWPLANEIHRALARQFIEGIQPDLGTDHMPALRRALRDAPDVVFFLTDAGEPELYAAQFQELRRLNRRKAPIHCIEFGEHSELRNVDNFLKRLARDTGGRHRYFDVTRFPRDEKANP